MIDILKQKNIPIILATNPIFPAVATEARISWAGLDKNDFLFYTTYENSRYCKPNPKYYLEVAEKLGVKPEECLMVGNDTLDDMVAETVGMKVFLLTNNLVNRESKDISAYPNGGYTELRKLLEEIL